MIKTKEEELQYLGLMLTATTLIDKQRIKAIQKRIDEITTTSS